MTRSAFAMAVAAGLAMSASAQAQISNGDFESGVFPPWAQFGDLGYTTVNAAAAHTGAWGGRFGPLTPGGINQTVTAAQNQSVTIAFWLNAGGTNNTFTVSLGGAQLDSIANAPAAWTFHTYTTTAASANPLLEFTFTNPPSYTNIDDVAVSVGTPYACCLPDGTCTMTTSAACSTQQGVFHDLQTCGQVTCPPPPTGRCCTETGSCSVITSIACASQGGVFTSGGNCTAPCAPIIWTETGDAGDLPGTAQVAAGSGPLRKINGELTASDTDMYQISICDRANFQATTVGNGNTLDTQLWIFSNSGLGLVMDDDTPAGVGGSLITGQFIPANGNYYIAITTYNRDAVDNASQLLFTNTNPSTLLYYPEWQPSGPGAANAVAGWVDTLTPTTGTYTIALTGACFVGGGCYANCDASTAPPILNANDFQCFLNKFAAQESYANCDNSTAPPILNANDFQCFLNSYAAGCT